MTDKKSKKKSRSQPNDNTKMPEAFLKLLSEGCINESDILKTPDGFWMIYKSLSDILFEKDIVDFPVSDEKRFECSKFYDDWFLYAVPGDEEHVYSLLKMREQEHDAENGVPADGDIPGVTISFISFKYKILLECIANSSDENRIRLDDEINRVVARRKQCHDVDLKRYFVNAQSEGTYLVADTYIKQIASYAADGYIDVPESYKKTVKRSISNKISAKCSRLLRFVEQLNRKAGYAVCDNEKIYIKNKEKPNEYEALAILSTHTGNTSLYSFAAEVEYHARFLTFLAKIRIPLLGRSIYDSAIRADMSIGETEFQGPAPFYRSASMIVKRQYKLHSKIK